MHTPERSLDLPPPIVGNIDSLPELEASLRAKGTANPLPGLYPRDGLPSVAGIEEQISQVTIPGQVNNVVWVSGMAAVRETVNCAAIIMSDRGTRGGDAPIVMHGLELYSQSTTYFSGEKKKGLKVFGFDSGEEKDVEKAIDERGADVVFAETVANTPGMPVLNVHRLLEQVRSLDEPPIVILDNTLPLSTGLDFATILEPNDPVIIVESGTKNLMNNSGVLGVTYSLNEELTTILRKHKAHSGAVNSPEALERLVDKLRLTIPGFHERNRAVFSSTGKIALALSEAQVELGEETDFYTEFPTNYAHQNYEYAQQITPEGLPFVSPVVFITSKDLSREGATKLYSRIVEHPMIREQINNDQIHGGQSFGTARARILYDLNAPNVRFAGGFDLADDRALAAAIKEALADK